MLHDPESCVVLRKSKDISAFHCNDVITFINEKGIVSYSVFGRC